MIGNPAGPARLASLALAVVLATVLSGCGSSKGGGGNGGAASGQPPTATMSAATKIGKPEGQLNLIAWPGYAQPQWVNPFEKKTGCMVNAKYAQTSNEMVALMANGGGGQFDLVSASGDADLRLIYGGDVRPVNVHLIPDWKNFAPWLRSPSFNTIDGVHYGTSLQWGPNTLLYNTRVFHSAPPSWSVIYNPAYRGKVTVPDNPIQIADAALFLSKARPNLGITDPYELTQSQFNAAIALLKEQRPLIKRYWSSAAQEISMFKNGDVVVGAAWPFQTNTLKAAGAPVTDEVPADGATGWADSWLLATRAPHPNCAYLWMKWVSTPLVQAEQAISFGETPDNMLACPIMNRLSRGSCAQYHANAPRSYFEKLKFWKTPIARCDNGKNDCIPYSQWQQAWTTEVTG
jgi:putative spermidine/putrescine transport system substrate-binding protein